jgi:hypothetical protein
MTAAGLPDALSAHAQGLHCLQAAAELLIGHAVWLQREDFLRNFVHTVPGLAGGTPMALIDWPEAISSVDQGQLPCSGSERRMLRIAASLADGIPVDLNDALTGLEARNADLVRDAVTRATGNKQPPLPRHIP